MSRRPGLVFVFLLVVVAGCSGGGGSDGGAVDASSDGVSAPSDSPPGAEAAGTSVDSGLDTVTAANDTAVGFDTTVGADRPSTPDASTALATVPPGDHVCLHKAASDLVAWTQGWDTECVVSVANSPPFTSTQKTSADYFCTFYDAQATTPASCPPREDMVGFCEVYPNLVAGVKAWTLVYKSKVLSDTDALSLNPAASGCLTQLYDPAGKAIPPRKCTGTVTAKVGGELKSFSSKLACTYKSDGTKSVYFVEADTTATDRLQLYVMNAGGVVSFVTDDPQTAVSKGAGYLEGGSNAFVTPVNAAARTLAATTFADRGASLVATFTLGDYKNGSSQIRTITEGSIDIKIEP